jgi:hypothetical protein
MSDDLALNSLIGAAADGLSRGCRVSLKLEGETDWMEIEEINFETNWPGLFKIARAGRHGTLMAPMSRLVAIQVGDGAYDGR